MPRPTVAEINLDAIASNLRQVRKLVGADVKICPAVKADAYGHGAIPVSRALLDAGAEMLSVALVEEAIELREAGITAPILVLPCTFPDQIPEIIRHGITSTICDLTFAQELSRESEAAGKRAKVHIKVDTGMGRIGVQPQEALDFAREVSKLPGIEIEGVFTHFPCADEEDQTLTRGQTEFFRAITEALAAADVRIPIRHTANSGAILNVPESYFEMVRPGIALYGLYEGAFAEEQIEFKQAMTLKTKIIFLKEIQPGTTVSYGRSYRASRPTRVATLPIGYADGYSRGLSNKGTALLRGMRVPVIGRVCMDQTMLDVTEVPGVSVGDEVVLYGRQGEEQISIREVAQLIGTITYDVVCSVGKRVPRVYVTGS